MMNALIMPSERSPRVPGARLLAAMLLGLTGCASGGGAPGDIGPQAAPAADSARIADVNQRILAAAPRGGADGTASFAGYRVGPNDRIHIDVFGAETFSGEYRVEDGGEIALPLLGSVMAAGHTPRELEELLESRLSDTYMRDPHVAIQVIEIQSQGVSVMGSVQSPGVYQITGRSTLLEVLAMAEGLTETAGNSVHVIRPAAGQSTNGQSTNGQPTNGQPTNGQSPVQGAASFEDNGQTLPMPPGDVVEVDLGALLESGRTGENIEVLPGDIVQVRPAGLVYVVGQVNQPGGFTAPPGAPMTVLQALAMAEGLGSTARASGSMIVREADDGSRHEIPVNLEEVLEGSMPPPPLQPRDVLFVPNNRSKAFALGIVNALVGMVTLRGLFY